MLNTPVLDSASIIASAVAALASFGGVSGFLTVLRVLFLDRLLSRLDSDSQNTLLRFLLAVLTFCAIVGLALLFGATPGRDLLLAAILATAPAATGSHFLYVGAQTIARKRADVPPDGARAFFSSSAK